MNERIVNVLGAFGYLSVLCQWLWATVIVAAPLFESDVTRKLLLPPESSQTETTVSSATIPEPIAIFFMLFAVVFAVAISAYAIVAFPKAVAKTGHKVTKTTVDVAVPRITHHKKLTKKQKKKLTERLTWTVKVGLVLLPLLFLIVPVAPQLGLDQNVVTSVALFCATVSLLWFGLQFILARLLGVPADKVW